MQPNASVGREGSDSQGRGEGEVWGGESEGQGSQLLRELARIELLARLGSDGLQRIKVRLSEIALESPGNLRLVRTLLNARLLDEIQTDGPQVGWPSDPCLEVDEETGESWILEDADEQHSIMELWCMLCEAEVTVVGSRDNIARGAVFREVSRMFTELEIILESYKIEHQVEGVRRIAEVIVRRESDPED